VINSFQNIIKTDDLHVGGEPVRVVTAGYPKILGRTILDKRRYVAAQHLRRMLMWEPRGHRDMYGVIPVDPDLPEAELAVLFMHNEGYSTMCGHATIAIGRWAIDTGRVKPNGPLTRLVLQCPCGIVEVFIHTKDCRPRHVAFHSVPAFVAAMDASVHVQGIGQVSFDLAYGGAFYAVLPASRLGTSIDAPVAQLIDRATLLSMEVRRRITIRHPEHEELGFLYGIILTDGNEQHSQNVCVFADGQIDRSPTGSGVTARVAIASAREMTNDSVVTYRSITGAEFTGRKVADVRCGPYPAVIVEVAGEAYWCGRNEFVYEAGDEIGSGFLLR
jgi:trans-L-3-hydroxyproline dehydratase